MDVSERRKPISVARVVVVGTTVVVDIAHIGRVVRSNGRKPPVAAYLSANNFLYLSLSDFFHFLIKFSASLKRLITVSIFSIFTVSTHSIILTNLF